MKNKALVEVFNKQLNSGGLDLDRCVREYYLSEIIPYLGIRLIGCGLITAMSGVMGLILFGLHTIALIVLASTLILIPAGVILLRVQYGQNLVRAGERWKHLNRVVRKYRINIGFSTTAGGVALSIADKLGQMANQVKSLEKDGYHVRREKLRKLFSELHAEALVLHFTVSDEGEFFNGRGEVRASTVVALYPK